MVLAGQLQVEQLVAPQALPALVGTCIIDSLVGLRVRRRGLLEPPRPPLMYPLTKIWEQPVRWNLLTAKANSRSLSRLSVMDIFSFDIVLR